MNEIVRNTVRAFARNTRSAIAIIFALSIFCIIGAAGAAIDFRNDYAQRTHIQSAVDASALAAANMLNANASERQKLGAIFEANYADNQFTDYKLSVIDDALVRVEATSTVPTYLMRVMGTDYRPLPAGGPSNSRTAADGEENLLKICEGMKARKIEVFTVGYDLTASHTLGLLTNCANPGQHYASTDIGNGLKQTRSKIAEQIQDKMIHLAN